MFTFLAFFASEVKLKMIIYIDSSLCHGCIYEKPAVLLTQFKQQYLLLWFEFYLARIVYEFRAFKILLSDRLYHDLNNAVHA